MISNADIAKILREISEYLGMESEPFKPRAYEKAAEAIESLSDSAEAAYSSGGIDALKKIPGVGESIAEKIEEFIETGKIKYYAELKAKTPVELSELRRIEGLGPRKIKALYDKLGIKNLKDLDKAIAAGKIRDLEGFGEKSEIKFKKGLEFVSSAGNRMPVAYAVPLVEEIRARLLKVKGVKTVVAAGSYRRRRETIGDIDLLVISNESKRVTDCFTSMPEVAQILASGETKSSVKLKTGMDVDLRVVPDESYGAALNYFTGSKDHNVALREIAIGFGLKLNEYGLYKGSKLVAGKTEEDIYNTLKLSYIPPELRENTGEIELARKGKLPEILQYGDVLGDLQVQTNWTDGAHSILQMAEAAMKLGRKYIAITDHTKSLGVANGLDEKRLREQMREIDAMNVHLSQAGHDFRVLKGTECDILKDGRLDLPDSLLAELDVVGVSVHSNFNLSREEQTKRVKRAMANPHADIFFHPTGRLIGKREGYQVDIDEIIRHAKATATVLEINAFPERSDLSDQNIRKCVDLGVKMSIDSDAHHMDHLSFIEYGISQARRGWATKRDIINAWPFEKMFRFLKKS
ncbi:MAG: DNA polymerase III [Candidatus Colwellbacteria bacterium RIFCSPLOWO2_01_FULL_48_10]|uniref:DNA polymerase beta n=1 Tax=Candidatus Colwellbacteria bacterium RIFCSPLOWO2_01_FULL_48_10 TaxID=1797690 RepID=A0A1G1Z4Z4_9BACT|nr:MAG: DNA polymerase III [Candidatus Colwellbacteria bacterium RIFCSPLOWO2_01_FULL_48_10]